MTSKIRLSITAAGACVALSDLGLFKEPAHLVAPGPSVCLPQDIAIDMGQPQTIKAFTYLPRQDKRTDGIADRYIFYSSDNGADWQKLTEGEFSNIRSNPLEQLIQLSHPVTTRYFKFSILHVVGGNGVAVAELGVNVN